MSLSGPDIEALTAITILRSTLKTLVAKELLSAEDMNAIVDDAKTTLRSAATMNRIPKTMSAIEQFRGLTERPNGQR